MHLQPMDKAFSSLDVTSLDQVTKKKKVQFFNYIYSAINAYFTETKVWEGKFEGIVFSVTL